MRKIISIILCASFLVGSLAACSGRNITEPISSNITVATSDAENYALWLTERLDTVPNDVILGIGNNDSYAVDMSNFENDGYIIKKVLDDVVIFGATEEGLDRGVRKYANLIDLKGVSDDITYHEGYRIDQFEIFGHSISDFVIEYSTESNVYIKFAASELKRLLNIACGAELEIIEGAAVADHKIILRPSDDESLGVDGYRYFEENGNLVIEGGAIRGCMYGVYRFLQNECGWEGLNYGESELLESELVSIPEGIDKTEVPAFEFLEPYANMNPRDGYYTDRANIRDFTSENLYYPVDHACHGISNYKWADEPYIYTQICYTSEGIYETVFSNITKYLKRMEEGGEIIGYSLNCIDISQSDNNYYCTCSECLRIAAEEHSMAGPMLRFSNRLAEEINEIYPGVAIKTFAYFATKIPPVVTKANDMVHITFAQNGNCSIHPMDGSLCGEQSSPDDDYYVTNNNKDNDKWLSGWCDIAKNVTVWYYALDEVLLQYTILDELYKDMKYMKELGVRGIFFQDEFFIFGIKRVELQMMSELNWVLDSIDEEGYHDLLLRMLRKEYGDGYEYIMDYIDIWIEAINRSECSNCWGMSNMSSPLFDMFYIYDTHKISIDLVDKAISLAESSRQERRAIQFSCHVYYESAYSGYFRAYEEYDTEELAYLEGLYQTLHQRIREAGFNPNDFGYWGGSIQDTLEKEAWLVWKEFRINHVGGDYSRPEPDWVMSEVTQ